MPLKMHLRQGQRVFINGAVLENATNGSISLLAINDAQILRDTDVLKAEDAVTPAARVYFALQCLYLFPEHHDRNLRSFNEFLDNYVLAASSAKEIADQIRKSLDDGQPYKALKECQKLIEHEKRVLTDVQERIKQNIRSSTIAGKS